MLSVDPVHEPFVRRVLDECEDTLLNAQAQVLMATFEADGRHYALPTMAGGKQLSDPFAVAKARGLSNFPNFATQEEAEQWISENHGNITGTDD